jgi:hypothetical protein
MSYHFGGEPERPADIGILDHDPEMRDRLNAAVVGNDTIVCVGWRKGSGYTRYDHLCSRNKRVVLVEIFEKNCRDFTKPYDNIEIFHSDIKDYVDVMSKQADVLLWQHGPEHMTMEDAVAVIGKMKSKFKKIIIEMPIGVYKQGTLYGNKHERHLSTWYLDDMVNLGFEVTTARKGGIGLWEAQQTTADE